MFVLNDSETVKMDDVKKVLIGRLLCDSDEFEWLKKKITTTQKSHTTSVPILGLNFGKKFHNFVTHFA